MQHEHLCLFLTGFDEDPILAAADIFLKEIPDAHILAACPSRPNHPSIIHLPADPNTVVPPLHSLAAMVHDVENTLLLIWDAQYKPIPGCLTTMIACLHANPVAGVCPLLLRPDREHPHKRRVLSMGIAVDWLGQLHSLHEGIEEEDPKAQKTRFFQLASSQALLLRLADGIRVGGYSQSLDPSLLGFDLTLKLKHRYPLGIALEPKAKAVGHDLLATWETLSLWNSMRERGRISSDLVVPDYQNHLADDGYSVRIDAWLNEVPSPLPRKNSLEELWLSLRYAPNPRTLTAYLRSIPQKEAEQLIALCQEYPSNLPHAYPWYEAKAKQLLAIAQSTHNIACVKDLTSWLKTRESFSNTQLRPAMQSLKELGFFATCLDVNPASFDAWQELCEPHLPSAVPQEITVPSWPAIGILMPVYNPNLLYLQKALSSIFAQDYPHWQLCLADDASTDVGVADFLKSIAKDPRISLTFRPVNGHIAEASNSALALATTPYIAFMDQDDLLAHNALSETARHLVSHPNHLFVFSDEDHIDENDIRRTPIFKHKGFFTQSVSGHLSTFRTSLVREKGGLKNHVVGAQDFDLQLRLLDTIRQDAIGHIPRILYHWRVHQGSSSGSLGAKPYVIEAHKKVLYDHIARLRLSADLYPTCKNTLFRIAIHTPPSTSIGLVLLGDTPKIHPTLLKSLARFETSLSEVFWQPCPEETTVPRTLTATLKSHHPHVHFQILPKQQNLWTACNACAHRSQADILLFMTASLVPHGDCRLEQLAYFLLAPSVALVTGYIWQNGNAWDLGMYPVDKKIVPLGRGWSETMLADMFIGRIHVNHPCLGGGGYPLAFAVPRRPFLEEHGFSEEMGAFAQVDYVLRQEQHGEIALACPWGSFDTQANLQWDREDPPKAFMDRWQGVLANHSLSNPLLHASKDNGWNIL